MILYLVRHGESAYNLERRIQGQLDIPLSPTGERQAETLASAFTDLPIDALFASPLRRAMQTAEPLAKSLGLPIQTDDRLREIHAGVFQGVPWDELAMRYPTETERWRSFDPDYAIPGGESRRELMQRGHAALEAIRERGLKQVVVVAHGGVLSAALKALLGIPAERNPFSLFNASVTRLYWDTRVRLITLNEIEHVRRAGIPGADSTGEF